uniref:Amphiphysin n=1 Tax=Tetraodon nigroviridis TaxID=99883 RepID=H3CAU1_TETNG
MAEIKTGIFAKNVQKRLNRAQEKVLQKLGKADETKDEQFEQVVINFRRQESEGSRLQREMKAYMAAIKGMQQASINLSQSLHEVYEPDWHGKDDVLSIGKDCDALWEDFHNKLVDSTLLNLDAYLLHFPDLKGRVAKRSRKLIDYDSARHHLETLQMSGMKNDRKMMKAEDELKKAQQVFDELNGSLQNELATLWDSRVNFYISTFKSVSRLEARFHREISVVCRQLYEVMTKLAEQHSDKVFTIQGAPSDSGPVRLAQTPSPPEDESPPDSPDAGFNHSVRPVSPRPPRPKSPPQLKKGPPVPPLPKVTPTKEVAEEQIIDFFGGEFLPAPSPLQVPNERPGQSLLDLDLDAFQPDESVSPIPQVTSQVTSQTAVPWDMYWSADFGEAVPGAGSSAAGLEGDQDGAQSGLHLEAGTAAPQEGGAAPSAEGNPPQDSWSPTSLVTRSRAATEDREGGWFRSSDGSGSEYETAEVPAEAPPSEEAELAEVPVRTGSAASSGHQWSDLFDLLQVPADPCAEAAPQENMSIPSVIIEPASSNEGDDDRDGDIISPTAAGDNHVTTAGQPMKHMGASGGGAQLPEDFLFKVETMHDFEAANSDELELKRGDVVLVVPTESLEDQDAGWLTGIRESDWLARGASAQKGLFPENFTQRLE